MALTRAAPQAGEVASNDAPAADGADRPAALARQRDRMLGHEHAPRPTAFAQHCAVGIGGGVRTVEPQPARVPQAARVAHGFETQRLAERHAMRLIEAKGIGPEALVVVHQATPSAAPTDRRGADPVRELVQEREPGVGRVQSGDDADGAARVPRDAR